MIIVVFKEQQLNCQGPCRSTNNGTLALVVVAFSVIHRRVVIRFFVVGRLLVVILLVVDRIMRI